MAAADPVAAAAPPVVEESDRIASSASAGPLVDRATASSAAAAAASPSVGGASSPGSPGVSAKAAQMLSNHDQVEWPPLRCTPSLKASHAPLVDFLSSGYGYDQKSVAAAVRMANGHFESKNFARAIDMYSVAYELGRLHFDYKPLMHDLALRRAICHSMLGDCDKALNDTELALRVVPHSAAALLYRGLIYTKLGEVVSANEAFVEAVLQYRDLRDLVDVFVAFHAHAQTRFDRAIQICTQVLARSPRFPVALLVRGDAYKFHPSGYFAKQAADDYTALLEVDPDAQAIFGEMMTPKEHTRFDELILRFHPRLWKEGPRPYEDYPMFSTYRVRRPLLVASLVSVAAARLKTAVRSTQLVKSVQQRNLELFEARAAAERKVRRLVETQQKLATIEASSFSEVWGPAHPDHVKTKKYRRFWMEKPLNFPKRQDAENADESADDTVSELYRAHRQVSGAESDWDAATLATLSPSILGSPSLGLSPPASCAGQRFGDGVSPRTACWAAAAAAAPRVPSPPSTLPASSSAAKVSPRLPPPSTVHPTASAASEPAAPFSSPPPPPEPPVPLYDRSSPRPPSSQPPELGPFGGPASNVDLILGAAAEPSGSPPPHPMARRRSLEQVYAPKPPPSKVGETWNEKQWLAKALELADTFAVNASAAPLAEPPAAKAASASTSAAAAQEAESAKASASERERKVPPPTCQVKLQLPGGVETNMVEALADYGLGVLPDWFSQIDRIYEVMDMGFFQTEPESLAAAPGLAGAPGFSYIVPKQASGGGGSSRPPRGHFFHSASAVAGAGCGGLAGAASGAGGGGGPLRGGPHREAAAAAAAAASAAAASAAALSGEALLKRYQNRIVQTSLPGVPVGYGGLGTAAPTR